MYPNCNTQPEAELFTCCEPRGQHNIFSIFKVLQTVPHLVLKNEQQDWKYKLKGIERKNKKAEIANKTKAELHH